MSEKPSAVLLVTRHLSLFTAFWSGRRESNPRPTAWKAVTLPLSYSRSNCPAFSISEVLRCAQDLGCGLPPAKRLKLLPRKPAIGYQLSVRPQRLKPLFFATLNGM